MPGRRWITEKVGKDVTFGTDNVSTVRQAPELLPETRARLEEYFAPEYDIYSHLRETGTWAPPKGYIPKA